MERGSDSLWISCEGRHQLHQQKAGAWNRAEHHPHLSVTALHVPFFCLHMISSSLPTPTCAGPVEHFVHGSHSVAAHGCHVTTSHNGIVHPRMHRQFLPRTKGNISELLRQSNAFPCMHVGTCVSLGFTLANRVFPVPGGPYMSRFLYRPLFCLVFLVAMATSRTRSSREGWGGRNQAGYKTVSNIRCVL